MQKFGNYTVNQFSDLSLSCVFVIYDQPIPQITWSRLTSKELEEALQNITGKIEIVTYWNSSHIVTTMEVRNAQKEDEGKYKCSASYDLLNYISSSLSVQYNEAFVVLQGLLLFKIP